MLQTFTRIGWRLTVAIMLAIAVIALPMHHLIAQVADSTAAGGAAGDVAASVGIFTVAGMALYQALKFVIKPLDRLPVPLHLGVIYLGNFLWQYAVPWIQGHLGVTLPGDLHQLGPAALAALIASAAMIGWHRLWQHVRDWLRAKGWWPQELAPAT